MTKIFTFASRQDAIDFSHFMWERMKVTVHVDEKIVLVEEIESSVYRLVDIAVGFDAGRKQDCLV